MQSVWYNFLSCQLMRRKIMYLPTTRILYTIDLVAGLLKQPLVTVPNKANSNNNSNNNSKKGMPTNHHKVFGISVLFASHILQTNSHTQTCIETYMGGILFALSINI